MEKKQIVGLFLCALGIVTACIGVVVLEPFNLAKVAISSFLFVAGMMLAVNGMAGYNYKKLNKRYRDQIDLWYTLFGGIGVVLALANFYGDLAVDYKSTLESAERAAFKDAKTLVGLVAKSGSCVPYKGSNSPFCVDLVKVAGADIASALPEVDVDAMKREAPQEALAISPGFWKALEEASNYRRKAAAVNKNYWYIWKKITAFLFGITAIIAISMRCIKSTSELYWEDSFSKPYVSPPPEYLILHEIFELSNEENDRVKRKRFICF